MDNNKDIQADQIAALEQQVLDLQAELASQKKEESQIGEFEPVELKHNKTSFRFPYPTISVEENGTPVTYNVADLHKETKVLDYLIESKSGFIVKD